MSEQKLVVIEANERKETGKGYNGRLRRAGKVPAVINGAGKSTLIELVAKDLPKAWATPGKRFQIQMGSSTKTVAIKELQHHPVNRRALHLDLVWAE